MARVSGMTRSRPIMAVYNTSACLNSVQLCSALFHIVVCHRWRIESEVGMAKTRSDLLPIGVAGSDKMSNCLCDTGKIGVAAASSAIQHSAAMFSLLHKRPSRSIEDVHRQTFMTSSSISVTADDVRKSPVCGRSRRVTTFADCQKQTAGISDAHAPVSSAVQQLYLGGAAQALYT